MIEPEPEVVWQEVPLSTVLNYYAQGYKPADGATLTVMASFCDTSKGVVLFKILRRPKATEGEVPA